MTARKSRISMPYATGGEFRSLPVTMKDCGRLAIDVWAPTMEIALVVAQMEMIPIREALGLGLDDVSRPIPQSSLAPCTFIDRNTHSATWGEKVRGWKYTILFDLDPASRWRWWITKLRLEFFRSSPTP